MIVPTAQSPVPDPDQPIILYVEDEVLLRAATADDMREAGFLVREAGTVGEAMAVLESSMPLDALITDIRLPGEMDGMDLACLAHRVRPALKIVAASAYIPDWPAPNFVEAYFGKPYDVARVVRRVRELLANGGRASSSKAT